MRLEAEQIALLNPTARERYMALEKLFASDGWKIVMALATNSAATALQRAAVASTWEENRMSLGNSLAWNAISNMEGSAEADFENQLETAEEEARVEAIIAEADYE